MLFDHRSVQINLLLLSTRRFLWRHQALARSSCCLRTVEFDQNSLCNARLCFEAKTDRCRCVNKAGVEASPSPCVSADVLPLAPPVPKRFRGITRMVSAPKKRVPARPYSIRLCKFRCTIISCTLFMVLSRRFVSVAFVK